MRLNRTKYAHLSVNELLRFADSVSDSLPEVGKELMYRLEDVWLHPNDQNTQEAPPLVQCDEK